MFKIKKYLPEIISTISGFCVNLILHILLFITISNMGPGGIIIIIYFPVFLPIILGCQILFSIIVRVVFFYYIKSIWQVFGFVLPGILILCYMFISSTFGSVQNFYTYQVLTREQRYSSFPLIDIEPNIYQIEDNRNSLEKSDTFEIRKAGAVFGNLDSFPFLHISKETKVTPSFNFDANINKYIQVTNGKYWDRGTDLVDSNLVKEITIQEIDQEEGKKIKREIGIKKDLESYRKNYSDIVDYSGSLFELSDNSGYMCVFYDAKNGKKIYVVDSTKVNFDCKKLEKKSYLVQSSQILNRDYESGMAYELILEL